MDPTWNKTDNKGGQPGLYTFQKMDCRKPTLSDMGPDGLYGFQSNSFGTNGQNLLLLTRNNELNVV